VTWRDRAACAGSTVDFFDHNQINQALMICHGCPVVDDCLGEALALPAKDDAGGVFGGMTKAERDRMRPKGRHRQPCGTYAAYVRHKNNKTAICSACREANRLYQQAYRERKKKAA